MFKKHFQNNYINQDDSVLGKIDQTRDKFDRETQDMNTQQELKYYQQKLRQALRQYGLKGCGS